MVTEPANQNEVWFCDLGLDIVSRTDGIMDFNRCAAFIINFMKFDFWYFYLGIEINSRQI